MSNGEVLGFAVVLVMFVLAMRNFVAAVQPGSSLHSKAGVHFIPAICAVVGLIALHWSWKPLLVLAVLDLLISSMKGGQGKQGPPAP